MRSFGSDNHSGVHPRIVDALLQANIDHAVAYGGDPWTRRAIRLFRKEFGPDIAVFFVFGGTGANGVGIAPFLRTHEAVICSSVAHLWVHESTAPEALTGCRLIPIDSSDGKLTVDLIRRRLGGVGDEHEPQPRVISISQSNELGLVYTPAEVRAITRFAHANGLYVHVDGARLANASASLRTGLRACTRDAGIDSLSFGGTKNGMMFGEAVVFFRPEAARLAPFMRKRAMQLPSKMRFVSAQFEAILKDRLWADNASRANRMARLLARRVRHVNGVTILHPIQTNMVFARLSRPLMAALLKRASFYVQNDHEGIVRWVASFDTTEQDVDAFAVAVRKSAAKGRRQ